jgi:carbon-monoxide dehydrogenase large subunit
MNSFEIDKRNYVLGKGKFVDDIYLKDMLYLKVVRSPYARAKILKVKGEITGYDLKASMSVIAEEESESPIKVDYPVLATDYVNYVGQPVAAVLGKDRYEVEDKAEEVEVEYELLKPIVDPFEALKSEPIHKEMDSNIFNYYEIGEKNNFEASVIVSDQLCNERVIPNPIEPRGIVAYYDGNKLNIWASTQSVHSWREGLATVLNIPKEMIRVIHLDTGGAFGSKASIYPEYVIAAYASIKTKKPVKWIETRREHLLATQHGRGVYAKINLGSERDGKILFMDAEIIIDAGAYALGIAMFGPSWISYQITGPYAIRNLHVVAMSVCTNKVPLGPYRGAGRPEAAFFIERMMDLLADELKIDPVELRLRNLLDEEFVSITKFKVPPAKTFFENAVNALKYKDYVKKGEKVGVSFFVLIPDKSEGESVKVVIENGEVKVWLGGSVHGQGHEEFVKKIVSKELGVGEEKVKLMHGDTQEIDTGVGTWGSRSAILAGSALVEACRRIIEKAKKELGDNFSIEELLKGRYEEKVIYEVKGINLNSLGANLAVAKIVEGKVKITEILAYYDAGKVLVREVAEGQVIGGSIQGLSQVYFESAPYNKEGQLLVSSILDAGVPSAMEATKVIPIFAEYPSPIPAQAKGLGESPTIGVPPAVVRAIEQVTGKRIRKTPINLEDWILLADQKI